jgi:hypothetical protein
LSEGSFVPLTPACQEIGHFLLTELGRVHNGFYMLPSPKNLCTPKASPKNRDQMSTLVARLRSVANGRQTLKPKRKEEQ